MADGNGSSLIPVTGLPSDNSGLSGAVMQDLTSSLGSQQPTQTQGQQPAPDQTTQRDLTQEPRFIVHATHYGYKGDPYSDANSAKGIGSFGGLTDGVSIGLTPDLEDRFGAKPGEAFVFTDRNGNQHNFTFGDRTSSSLRGRIDIYDPTGQIGDLGEGTISRPGAAGPTIPALETSNTEIQKQPAAFGMRVATPDDVKDFDSYIKNGGDVDKIPVYDQLAVAIAKDPKFLTKPENFEAFYGLVYKPLLQQSSGEQFANAVMNVGPGLVDTVKNVGLGIANEAELASDGAQLAFRKATGLVHDPGYESTASRVAQEQATQSYGMGQGVSDAWNFVTGIYNGLIQTTRPVGMLFAHDQQSREELDRKYAQAFQQTAAGQQALAGLGKQLQETSANAYKATGAFADVGQKIQTAQPNQAAAQGIATLFNPLNLLPLGAGAETAAIRPLAFEKGLQSMEDLAGANARKLVLDTTQMLPENPGLSAANPGYVETRNLQSQFAPAARAAAQDVSTATNNLNQHLTTIGKVAGDPGTPTWLLSQALQKTGAGLDVIGNTARQVSEFPGWIANKVSGGNPLFTKIIKSATEKALFGGMLEKFGPLGGAAEAVLAHAPELADNVSGLFKTAGKELMYGESTIPYWTRVAQQTDAMPKFLAQALDSPAVQRASAIVGGGAAGAATSAVLGGLQEAGSVPGGGPAGAVSGLAQGGILGMAGAGLGQWQKFNDPNQYLLQARGDWKRYRDMLSPQDQANFAKLSPTNQLILGQSAPHFPGLKVSYVNNPIGPQGFHFFDDGGRSNIQINLANQDSVIRGIMAHELIHGATHAGMLPDLYDSLFGNPQTGKTGQFTALDSQGKPVGVNPATGRYFVNQDFNNLANQYTNKMAQNGLPTAHINDFAIAKEIYAENGVDYLLSGAPILDSNSAYRPGLVSTSALKTALAKTGYTFDQNGVMIGGPGAVTGTGLFTDLQRNPALANMAKSYFTQRYRDGTINSEEQPTHRFTKQDMQNPNVPETWLTNAAEIVRKPDGTAARDPNTGLPIYRSPKEVKEYNAQFAQAVRTGLDTLPEDQRADLGIRQTPEGNTFVRYLPDHLIDSLAATNQYNPHQIAALRMLSRTLADKGNPGMEMSLFYHKALTEGKRYRAFEGTEKIAVPYGLEVTKDNNVNIKSVDFNQLTNNYLRVRNRDPFKSLWSAPDDFAQDAHTYFVNHSQGRPGADAIGQQKRDAINSLANFGTELHRDSNPLVDTMPNSVRPIIKSYRIDRANQIKPTGAMRPFISEEQYYKMNRNYLPGASDEVSYLPRSAAPAAPAPSQFPEAIPVATRPGKDGKPQPVPIPYDITKSPLIADKYPQKLAKDAPDRMSSQFSYINPTEGRRLTALDDASAVTTFANKLVPMLKDWLKDPEIAPGKDWYNTIGDKLNGAFGKGANQFMEFLAATSPMKRPHENFLEAYEAKTLADQGHYDRHIDLYNKARDMMSSDPDGFINHVQDLTGNRAPSQAKALAAYIDHHDILPLKANDQKYGFNSEAVLRVLAGRWREDVKGPKTPQFNKNITGENDDPTIDDWAARTLREIGYKDHQDQWRIQPASKTGVSNEDFAFGQLVFKRAAAKLGLKPKEAQALAWVGEQDKWVKNGWADIPSQGYDKPFDLAFPKGGPRLPVQQLREALKK